MVQIINRLNLNQIKYDPVWILKSNKFFYLFILKNHKRSRSIYKTKDNVHRPILIRIGSNLGSVWTQPVAEGGGGREDHGPT